MKPETAMSSVMLVAIVPLTRILNVILVSSIDTV
jgi:hypothetical protein